MPSVSLLQTINRILGIIRGRKILRLSFLGIVRKKTFAIQQKLFAVYVIIFIKILVIVQKKMEASVNSSVHGFHVYQDVWTPVMGKILVCPKRNK